MTTGTSSSNSDTSPTKKKGWPRGRKRRMMPKDVNAPKAPLSGYMLFTNEQRDSLKQTPSKAGFSEITKTIAQRWAQLDAGEKQKYLDAAEAEKERYQEEVERYRKTDTYKKFLDAQNKDQMSEKRPKKEVVTVSEKESTEHDGYTTNRLLEIPIFTEEFLNHNKIREGELRQLRKSNTEYEEQNTILQKHIESMRSAVEKLDNETKQQRTKNASLKQHLSSLRKTLTHAFSSTTIPGTTETPTEETVDNFMTHLHSVLTSNPQQHQKLIQNVKQIVNNLPNN